MNSIGLLAGAAKQVTARKVAVIGTLAATVLLVVLNAVYQEDFFSSTLDFVADLQGSYSKSSGTMVLMNIFSQLVNPVLIVAVIIVILSLKKDKLSMVTFLMYFILCTYLCSFMKSLYQQARPFWVDAQIRELDWTCYMEYGNPSGHAMLGPIIWEYIFVDLLMPLTHRFWVRCVLFAALVALVVVIGLSRIYLGMHGPNQVLFGVALGIACIILYRFALQDNMEAALRRTLFAKKKTNALILSIAALILLFTVPILQFCLMYKYSNKAEEAVWLLQISAKCAYASVDDIPRVKTFFYKDCTDCAIGMAVGGVLLGAVFANFPNFITGEYDLPRGASCAPRLKCAAVVLVTAIVSLVFLVLPYFHHTLVKYLWQAIGFFLAALSIFVASPYFLHRLRWAHLVPEESHRQTPPESAYYAEQSMRWTTNPGQSDTSQNSSSHEPPLRLFADGTNTGITSDRSMSNNQNNNVNNQNNNNNSNNSSNSNQSRNTFNDNPFPDRPPYVYGDQPTSSERANNLSEGSSQEANAPRKESARGAPNAAGGDLNIDPANDDFEQAKIQYPSAISHKENSSEVQQ